MDDRELRKYKIQINGDEKHRNAQSWSREINKYRRGYNLEMREIVGWIPCQSVSELEIVDNSDDGGYDGQECVSRGHTSGTACEMVANALS